MENEEAERHIKLEQHIEEQDKVVSVAEENNILSTQGENEINEPSLLTLDESTTIQSLTALDSQPSSFTPNLISEPSNNSLSYVIPTLEDGSSQPSVNEQGRIEAFPPAEKYKVLYEYSKEVLAEASNHTTRLEQKSATFLTIVTILLGLSSILLSLVFGKIIPPIGYTAWLTLIFTSLGMFGLISSLVLVIYSLSLHQSLKLRLDEEQIKFFKDNLLIDIYYAIPVEIQEGVRLKVDSNLRKAELLRKAFYSLITSVILLACAFIFYGSYKWVNTDKEATTVTNQDNKPSQTVSTPQPSPEITPQTNTVTPTPQATPQTTPQTNTVTPTPQATPQTQSRNHFEPDLKVKAPKLQTLIDNQNKSPKRSTNED